MTTTKYTVAPFSGKNYEKNERKCADGFTPCCICGKGIADGTEKHTGIVISGGSSWGDDTSDENDPGYMGGYPVGNDCHKKYAVK